MTYSKRDRELAAVRCQLLADHWARRDIGRPYAYDFKPSHGAVSLSEAACSAVDASRTGLVLHHEFLAQSWAEAESWIRDGWTP